MKIMILKDMDDDSVLRILSCADDVDTDALAKDILEKEYEIDGEIRDIDEVCANFNLSILLSPLSIMVFMVFKDKRYRMCR